MSNTLWTDDSTDTLYYESGQFSGTIRDSFGVSAFRNPTDIAWDGSNSFWSKLGGGQSILVIQSGRFSATVKDSVDMAGIDNSIQGITCDDTNVPWSGTQANKLYLNSGKVTATLKTSQSANAPNSISWDGTNTPYANWNQDVLTLSSGQFTGTIKATLDVTSVDNTPSGISWDGTDTPWAGAGADKLYKQSGQFNATLKTSRAPGVGNVTGIGDDDFDARTGAAPPAVGPILQHPLDYTRMRSLLTR